MITATSARVEMPSYISERMVDIKSIIANIARTYSDQSCYALSYEDLSAECFSKLAQIVSSDKWQDFVDKPRNEFFAYVRTVFNNHVKSIVVRYRLTAKRGYDPTTRQKNVDVNVDDYAETIQAANAGSEGKYGSPMRVIDDTFVSPAENEHFLKDVAVLLTPIEYLVLRQILLPNHTAWLYQYALSNHTPKKIKIGKEALACGLGIFDMTVQQRDGAYQSISAIQFYELIEKRLKSKLERYMQCKDNDTQFNVAVKNLEIAFGLQIPGCIDACVIRRIMTMAARDQFDKLTDSVIADLETVGAIVPKARPDGTIRCYGVLYNDNAQACKTCQLCTACKVAAVNVGLDLVTLTPRVLESTATRVPVACINMSESASLSHAEDKKEEDVATQSVADEQLKPENHTACVSTPAPAAVQLEKGQDFDPAQSIDLSSRNAQIVQYIYSVLKPSKNRKDLYFQSRSWDASTMTGKAPYIFVVRNEREDLVQEFSLPLRFAKPSDNLKPSLTQHKTGYYLPVNCGYEDALVLIKQHIDCVTSSTELPCNKTNE